MLIDTHAHLTDERYGTPDEIISSMSADGLERIICVGYDFDSSTSSLKIAEKNDAVYCAVGFHPCDASKIKDGDCEKLFKATLSPKCVAVGEIGLDYHYPDTNKRLQFEMLEKMFDLV